MTADPYARVDAAYLLGAFNADERLPYEAHLATWPAAWPRHMRTCVRGGTRRAR